MMDLGSIRRLLIIITSLILLAVLASCGQKGDLYLPDKTQASLQTPHVTS